MSKTDLLASAAKTRATTTLAWRSAGDLAVGDTVITVDGRRARVKAVKGAPGLHTVHNFAVEQHHTYFVGQQGVWVHNQYKVELEDTVQGRNPAFLEYAEDALGIAPGERIDAEEAAWALISFLQDGTEGLEAAAGTKRIRQNLEAHLDAIGADAVENGYGHYEGDWASALAQNEAIIGVYASIGMINPDFQWADLGIYVAQQVREELIGLHRRDATYADDLMDKYDRMSPLYEPGSDTHYHRDGMWKNVFDKTFDIQRTIVLDLAPLAIGFGRYGASAMRDTFKPGTAAYDGFDYLVRADQHELIGQHESARYSRMRAAQKFGLHEQTNVQPIWDSMKGLGWLNQYSGPFGVSTNIQVRGENTIGEIDAPGWRRGDTSDLDYRVSIANNGFEWMLENVHNNSANRQRHEQNLRRFMGGEVRGRR